MQFSIKSKLAVAFGVPLLLSGAAGMIGIVKLAAVDSNIRDLLTARLSARAGQASIA